MNTKLTLRLGALLPALIGYCGVLMAATYDYDVHAAEELRARDGLPNVLARAQRGETVNVAYVGGSITAAAGWRVKTLAWLREQYPQTTFHEINAAISGTGSDYAACRLQEDVLSRNPDLVFIEFRVNGGGGFVGKSMEGIVRQIWTRNPQADICFVYTVGEWMLPKLQEGRNDAWDSFGAIAEGIANRYGIPTIDLGVDVARREKAGELIFKAPAPVEGKLVFSQDGVHPGDGGHELYKEAIARSFTALKTVGREGAHLLPEPLEPGAWVTATLLPISQATLSGGWTTVDMATDPVIGADRGRTIGMLRGAVKCDRAGETITVRFNGTCLALTDIPAVEPIMIEVSIDGGAPQEIKRAATEGMRRYGRYWWTPELPAGEHTATYTVKSLPEGVPFYAGQLWVAGTPLPR